MEATNADKEKTSNTEGRLRRKIPRSGNSRSCARPSRDCGSSSSARPGRGQIEARVKTEAQKARAQLASQIAALRDQGRKLATNLKSALGDASKRDAARQQALAKIAELKAEYSKKTADLRSELSHATAELGRKSEELKKLAGEAAQSRSRDNPQRRTSRRQERQWVEAPNWPGKSRLRKLKTAEMTRSLTRSNSSNASGRENTTKRANQLASA